MSQHENSKVPAFPRDPARPRSSLERARTPLARPVLALGNAMGRLDAPAALLIRVALGALFAQSGWGKLTHLERTAGYFESLGIVLPNFHAHLVANVEFLGGLGVLLGLGARLWSLPLAFTMIVAIATAQLGEVSSLVDLVTLDEFFYLAVLVGLVARGPGKWSFDFLLLRRMAGASPRGGTPEENDQERSRALAH